MQNCSITFKVGGEIITESRIREVELKRYQHVFEVFSKKGISITLNGRRIAAKELWQLTLDNAKIALAETREKMG
ncbi:MAG: hypothetical protein ABF682_08380 [Liquorilactobacillus sp.]|mgnify:CR=1 FL=1|uniref:hypothetical protein n=1 Tax=Liquorilactobacillus sp. TaxID=2767923 RepID=UPI0039EBE03C